MTKKKASPKLHAGDIEIIIAREFGYRRNLIVPNVFWGLGFRHELDILIVSPSGWAKEVEIKVSLSDLKADKKKGHNHNSQKIQQLYFAVPEKLENQAIELIPERAGLIVICYDDRRSRYYCRFPKTAKINREARKLTPEEITKLGSLAAMRIWSLKECIYRLQREGKL
jgi:hypothetical protein